jgi:deoxyribonuclease-4
MAVGMLDHSARIAVACGAGVVVLRPGFLLGRPRAEAIDAAAEQLGERLEANGRLVLFGLEIIGRVRELGTLVDIVAISSRVQRVRPVLDFAHRTP